MKISRLAVCISLVLSGQQATAAEAVVEPPAESAELGTVTVVGTRSEQQALDVPATVTVIEREQIDREQSRTLKDLLRYEPGVSVSQGYGRFGIGDVRIRGLGGNRVQLQVDGVDIADSFSIGSFSSAGRDFVDPELIERVELLRGSASALYGSDALAGVVAFRTRDPDSFISGADSHAAFRLGANLSSNDESVGANAMVAGVGNAWSALLHVDRRDGHETENRGTNFSPDRTRTAPNPQDAQRRGALAKLVRDSGNGHKLRIVLDGSEGEVQTEVLSSQGPQVVFGQTVLTSAMRADDRQWRARLAVGMDGDLLSWGFADSYEWQVYRQSSLTTQETTEIRASLVTGNQVNPTRRERLFRFDQQIVGIEALLRKSLSLASSKHELTYGLSMKHTDIDERRDGRAVNLTTGTTSNTITPDAFPVRDFPKSATRETGLFVQDEIQLLDGRLRMSPAIRWDRYRLSPMLDGIFAGDNPGITPIGLATSHVSPKLGMSWRLQEGWSVYASVAEGFRAPPYNDANLGFTNFQSGYTAIPNPSLGAETSRGVEIGSKAQGAWGSMALAFYDNRYRDFIESLRAIGVDPVTGLLVFQSQNIARVRIRGAEFSAKLDLAKLGAEGWQARVSLATAKGDDLTRQAPLNSVDPARAVLGLGYQGPGFGTELVGTFAQRKTRLAPLDSSGAPAFTPPGYGVVDLLGQVRLGDSTRLEIALLNLTDKVYWDWVDVPGIAASSALLDRYTRPGRGLAVSINHLF